MSRSRDVDVRRCDGCGKWVIREALCEMCAYVYARLTA